MELNIAFAVNDFDRLEPKHFGDAHKYLIYQWNERDMHFLEALNNPTRDMDISHEHGSENKGNHLINILKQKEVRVLVSRQFGANLKRVNQHFIPVLVSTSNKDEACDIVSKGIKWIIEDIFRDPSSYKLFDLRAGAMKIPVEDFQNGHSRGDLQT